MIGLVELQSAIYSVLSNGVSIPIYDSSHNGFDYPYVRISQSQVTDEARTKTEEVYEITQTIEVISKYTGQKEAKEVAETVNSAVLNGEYIMPTRILDNISFDSMEFDEEDNDIQRAIMQYTFTIIVPR